MAPRLRFAPSPTGNIHIGNGRTAILNYLYALQSGGEFLLRFDDTDLERSREEYVTAIREDLAWLGLTWVEERRQSERLARYDAVAAELKQKGLLYACYETPDELGRRRKRQLARGLPPIYDRRALKLTDEERQAFETEGRKPHWRFRLSNTAGAESLEPVSTHAAWKDVIRGEQVVDVGSLSDPVMIREDGSYLYTLTSVIDDADFAITHIIRGEDHVTNTGVQIQLFEAIGASPPAFGHHSLLVGEDGKALSKRLGSLAIASFRESGLEPMAVVSQAALIGSSDAIEPYNDIKELAERFAFSKISTAPGRFSEHDLRLLNAKLLHQMSFSEVEDRLQALGISGGEAFWKAVHGNLDVLSDARAWWQVVDGEVTPEIEDSAVLKSAIELLPEGEIDEATWSVWTGAIKAATGAKGKALFHPLRLALTGRSSGPEMKVLLPLIGRDKALKRLSGETA
jgi:glutamyl-tRNA synthetase